MPPYLPRPLCGGKAATVFAGTRGSRLLLFGSVALGVWLWPEGDVLLSGDGRHPTRAHVHASCRLTPPVLWSSYGGRPISLGPEETEGLTLPGAPRTRLAQPWALARRHPPPHEVPQRR